MIPFLFFTFQCFKIGKYFMVNLKNIKKKRKAPLPCKPFSFESIQNTYLLEN